MLKFAATGLVWALFATSALAASDQPLFAPPPAWVKPAPAPVPAPAAQAPAAATAADGAAIRALLFDVQVRFAEDGMSVYNETEFRIQNPQGLQAAGTMAVAWDPDLGDVTIHRLRILRDGQTIDILASQKFSVLRRESNLEAATLDGTLTAMLQPDDLRVGDVVDFAYTIRRKDPAMAGHAESFLIAPNMRLGALSLRALSAGAPFRWRASDEMDKVAPAGAGQGREVLARMTDVQPPIPPAGAPQRFQWGRYLQVSDFDSWAQVSALMNPLFDQAAVITPGSPLSAEVDRIKAASADPKARAQAALELVQQRVRYLALTMNDGGLVPAKAEDTWSRRFGDCKGKTVLLLAVLRALGVQAQPALASVEAGDGMDQRLPAVQAFDHVLIRAQIGGKTYWLDGTRIGDHDLDDIEVPGFKWALPLQASGAQLARLDPTAPAKPMMETSIKLDASAGLTQPAPAHVEVIMRGDAGVSANAALSNAPTGADAALRDYFKKSYDFIQPNTVSASFDDKRREERLVLDGVATMDWEAGSNPSSKLYETDGTGLGWRADFKREPGPHADAPYAVVFPDYAVTTETIVLPNKGQGFSIQGADVDQTVAGRAFKRVSKVDDGVATITASVRSVAAEFPAADAPAAAKTLTDMGKVTVYVVSPEDYLPTDQETAAAMKATSTTADDYINQGVILGNGGRLKEAVAAFGKAAALNPKSDVAWGNLAIDQAQSADGDGGKAAAAKALALNPNQQQALNAQGILAMRAHDYDTAIASFTHALEQSGNQIFTREKRAEAEFADKKSDAAFADWTEVLREQPYRFDLRRALINLLIKAGRKDEAVAQADAAVAAQPDSAEAHTLRGAVLAYASRKAEADAAFSRALALHPMVETYLTRARYRPASDLTGRIADFTAALQLEPDDYWLLDTRALAESQAGQFDKAVDDANKAVAAYEADLKKPPQPDPDTGKVEPTPKTGDYWLARGQVYFQAHRLDLAEKDFAAARAQVSTQNEAGDWNNLCWGLAIVGADLDAALKDCETALKLSPDAAAIIDSRAFVLLRLGRYDDAIAGYDQAVKLRPAQAESLFGRGLAELRKGQADKAKADMDAARGFDPMIDDTFAGYGLKP